MFFSCFALHELHRPRKIAQNFPGDLSFKTFLKSLFFLAIHSFDCATFTGDRVPKRGSRKRYFDFSVLRESQREN